MLFQNKKNGDYFIKIIESVSKTEANVENICKKVDENNKRGPLITDGEVHEVYTLPMGCSLYSMEVFYRIEQPWFETTECLTQDSFFSQKLRDAGYKLFCDTSIKCKHIDRVTSKVYE